MRSCRRFLQLSIPALLCCAAWAGAQSSQKTINNPGGGTIVYGPVAGAKTNAAAMVQMLVSMQNNCGERPRIGQLFRVRGTDSLAVFFTVVNHPQGNKRVAGMLIARTSGPNQVEAGMLSDDSARLGTTLNPMLKTLFGVWHPGGDAPPAGRAGGGRNAPPVKLHMAAAPDNSAYVAIPDGWKVVGGGGTVTLMCASANEGVVMSINLVRGGKNPSPYVRPFPPGMGSPVVYPVNADPSRAFPGIIREMFRLTNTAIELRVDHVDVAQSGPGYRCLHGVGAICLGPRPPGVPLWEFEGILFITAPNPMAGYTISFSYAEMDPRFADQWRATVGAIFQSFQVNQAVVSREANAIAAPAIANIRAIGQTAMARAAESDREHDIQHQDWRNGQDAQAKNVWGFSSGYLLDQSVVRDNETGGQTNWIGNNFANQLIQADPNRFEIVQNQDLLMGWNVH
jgi:hypothetical protein